MIEIQLKVCTNTESDYKINILQFDQSAQKHQNWKHDWKMDKTSTQTPKQKTYATLKANRSIEHYSITKYICERTLSKKLWSFIK